MDDRARTSDYSLVVDAINGRFSLADNDPGESESAARPAGNTYALRHGKPIRPTRGACGWETGIRRPERVDCGVHHRMRCQSGNRSGPTISLGDLTTVCGANREFLTTRSSSGEFTSRPALESRTPARSTSLCSAAAVAGPVTAQRVRRAPDGRSTITTNETAHLVMRP